MADDLAGLLAAGERAAFHGRPAAGVQPLRRATDLARDQGLQAESVGAGWLLGVCLVSEGRYGGALDVLEPLADLPPGETPAAEIFAALAGAALASLHRQLGRHAESIGHDERALARTDGSGEAGFDAILGLASDRIGLGDQEAARVELGRAEALVDGRSEWWRQRVRLDWVRAEVDLLACDPGAAVTAAHRAIDLAERSGAPRHVAKGLLFLGAAQVEAGTPAEAATTLRRSALLSESLGTLPLQWPARAMLGALLSDGEEGARCLESARTAVRAIADDLPERLRGDWLARPDVAALLGS